MESGDLGVDINVPHMEFRGESRGSTAKGSRVKVEVY